MIVVDLFSQRDVVAAELRRRSMPEKISWLQQHGELIDIPTRTPDAPNTYLFRSTSGIECGFYFQDGLMVFLGYDRNIRVVVD